MDNRKTFNFDEDLKIWRDMNQLIEEGASRRSAALTVCKEFDITAATIRGKYDRIVSSGGRAHGLAIFTMEHVIV
jgi:hypothetical protein